MMSAELKYTQVGIFKLGAGGLGPRGGRGAQARRRSSSADEVEHGKVQDDASLHDVGGRGRGRLGQHLDAKPWAGGGGKRSRSKDAKA